MPKITWHGIKYSTIISSRDPLNKAANLLDGDGGAASVGGDRIPDD